MTDDTSELPTHPSNESAEARFVPGAAERIVNQQLMERCLKMAVPMWVFEHQNKSIKWLMWRKDNVGLPRELFPKTAQPDTGGGRRSMAGLIGEMGDQILWRARIPGRTGFLFNVLAEGIAILSMICPGGVDFGDLHFEYPHKDLKKHETETNTATDP